MQTGQKRIAIVTRAETIHGKHSAA